MALSCYSGKQGGLARYQGADSRGTGRAEPGTGSFAHSEGTRLSLVMTSKPPGVAASGADPHRGCFVVPLLHQNIEHLAFIIDGAPQENARAADHGHHLVQMPARAWSRAAHPQPTSEHGAELQDPASDCLVGDVQTPLSQKKLRVKRRLEPEPHAG